jgi:hypothetical protein
MEHFFDAAMVQMQNAIAEIIAGFFPEIGRGVAAPIELHHRLRAAYWRREYAQFAAAIERGRRVLHAERARREAVRHAQSLRNRGIGQKNLQSCLRIAANEFASLKSAGVCTDTFQFRRRRPAILDEANSFAEFFAEFSGRFCKGIVLARKCAT